MIRCPSASRRPGAPATRDWPGRLGTILGLLLGLWGAGWPLALRLPAGHRVTIAVAWWVVSTTVICTVRRLLARRDRGQA